MPAEYVTRTRIAVGRDGAEAALEFERAAGKGKPRAAAARRLAAIYRVGARHPYRTLHYNPAGSEAPDPTPDELRLDVTGDPERVARYLSAVPRYLARVEALATKAARVYGRWARSAAGETALEYTDAGGARAYARRFRIDAFAAVADCFGISALPRYVDPAAPMWDQAARIAWDVVKAEGPVSLYSMHDEAEVEELLTAADRVPDPAAEAFERELAELHAAEARRSTRLFAALDGEELAADEASVEEAAAEDVVEDQESEELPAVTLTPVQRRWLHTAAAHPEGHLPAAVNLRTARVLGAAGLMAWTRPEGRRTPLAEAVWTLDAGEARITAAGRRRAAAEERERVVIVACGGRKAVYADGIRKGEPVIGERAGALYVGSYHRAMRRAADALTRNGRTGRVLILSAKYGLVELSQHLLNYDLKAGDPGTVDGETLRRQAHELGISGAAVTVLGGRAYTELAGEVWDDFAAPLAGTRGIGEQLARLAAIYDPARAVVEDVVEGQAAEELLGSLAAPVRAAELAPGTRPHVRSRSLSLVPVDRRVSCRAAGDTGARWTGAPSLTDHRGPGGGPRYRVRLRAASGPQSAARCAPARLRSSCIARTPHGPAGPRPAGARHHGARPLTDRQAEGRQAGRPARPAATSHRGASPSHVARTAPGTSAPPVEHPRPAAPATPSLGVRHGGRLPGGPRRS
ncbi:DUF6884 domain-containing protein [Streptomyces sindenensis]|uniref:DUF6884 domain-containing protein n=1 Tax=Streptomyces sindenensis TaxID=67363 RepID=A0ABW6EYP7_9ACTN